MVHACMHRAMTCTPHVPRCSSPLPPCPPAGHNYIGTEHILLGLLREGEGVAARVLETLGADPAKIRTQVGERRGCSAHIVQVGRHREQALGLVVCSASR